MKSVRNWVAFAALWAVASDVTAQQQGGVVEEFCETAFCIDDTLEVVFENGTSTYGGALSVGTLIPVQVFTQTVTSKIQGWSYAIRSDPASVEVVEATTEGTIAHPDHPEAIAVPQSFDATQVVPDGMISAVVLSFLTQVELPVGEFSAICNLTGVVRGPVDVFGPPQFEFVSGEVGPDGSPPTDINFTVDGAAKLPRRLHHGNIVFFEGEDEPFRRGDANGDGKLNVSDAFLIIQVAVGNRSSRFDCDDALDADDDGDVALFDAIPIFTWLFQRGPRLAAPFVGECELDGATLAGCNESNCQ